MDSAFGALASVLDSVFGAMAAAFLASAASLAARSAAAACAVALAAASWASSSASAAIRSSRTALAAAFPDAIDSVMCRVINVIERTESSLPGMGYSTCVGSQFVSTIATIGIPSFLASATAICSFSMSIINRT